MTLDQRVAAAIAVHPGEEWRPVVGWPEYAISSHGRILVLPRESVCARHVLRRALKLLSPFVGADGRGIRLATAGHREVHPIDRLVLLAFVGEPPASSLTLCPIHVNGDAFDDRLENLRWGTRCADRRLVVLQKMIAAGQAGASLARAGEAAGCGTHHTYDLASMLRTALDAPPKTRWPVLARMAAERKLDLISVVALGPVS